MLKKAKTKTRKEKDFKTSYNGQVYVYFVLFSCGGRDRTWDLVHARQALFTSPAQMSGFILVLFMGPVRQLVGPLF
jgi:hypothetical protein